MGALAFGYGLVGVLAAVPTVYLLLLAIASFVKPAPDEPLSGTPSVVVLVPAHNEGTLVGRCVRSLRDQTYPGSHYRIVVVADNCTDSTAGVALDAGAEVMVRSDATRRGKGQALRWAMDRLLAADDSPEAVIVVDADSVADRDFVRELVTTYLAGHASVQADDQLRNENGSLRAELERIALLLRNRIRFAGRAALGQGASLCGNGMLLSAAVLREHPWSAFSGVEDGEYSMILRVAGIETTFAARAKVFASTTSSESGAYTQGVRWEGGRFTMMRTWMPRLVVRAVRRRDAGLLWNAFDLAMPPLSAAAGLVIAGAAGAVTLAWSGLMPWWPAVPWAIGLAALPLYMACAFASARLPLRSYLALAALPAFALLKLRVYARLLRGPEHRWVRTERPAERSS